jgi:hypothetical protein
MTKKYDFYATRNYGDTIRIQKNISEYVNYTLSPGVHKIIFDKLDEKISWYSVECIIQAIDNDGDIINATKQDLEIRAADYKYQGYNILFLPVLYGNSGRMGGFYFTNVKFPMEWRDISNEDLAQMKSIKSRMVIRKR